MIDRKPTIMTVIVLVCSLLGLAAPCVANAAEAGVSNAGAARIPNAEQFDLRSAQGRTYRIFIASPLGDAPAEGFPVLYMLDGNSVFGTAVETSRLQRGTLGPVVIVGIGYPVDTPFDGPGRFLDYTPKTDPRHIPPHFDPDIVTGGQDAFLDFILDEVRPQVERRHRIDGKRQALFGHSLGGLFVLHTLFHRPTAFQTYIAGSPSIWWNDRSVLAGLDGFAAMPAEVRREVALMVVVGGDELGHIVLDARNLVTALPPIRNRYEEIPAQGHVSMLPAAINRALQFVLGPRR